MNHLLSQTAARTSETNSLPLVSKSNGEFILGTIKDLDELRRPILNLPDFATSSWFKKHLSVSRSHLRVFHSKWGRYVQPVTGFAWPSQRPDVEEFYDLLPEIAKYPYALRFILGGLFEKVRRWEKRLYQAYFAARQEAGLSIELASEVEGRHEQVVELAAAGKYEIARAMAILNWALYQSKTPAMARLALHDPEMCDYLRKFLACDHSLMSEMWAKYARGGNEEDPNKREVVDATWDDIREEVSSDVDDPFDDEKHPVSDGAPEQRNDTSKGSETDLRGNLDQPLSHLDSYTFASATDEWAARLSEIVQIAKRGQSLAPDRQICTELQSVASRLRDCVDAYEATQPNSIPTEHLIARLLAALAIVKEALTKIDGFDETTLGNVRSIEASAADAPQNVIPEVYTKAEALTVSAESSAMEVGIAQQRLSDADAALSHKEYFTVAPELFSRVVSAANEALARIDAGLRKFRRLENGPEATTGDRGPVDMTEPSPEPEIAPTVAPDSIQTIIEIDDGGEGDPDIEPPGDSLVLPALPTFGKAAEVIVADSDPLLIQIERKADELFVCQEFGLAYHLARAGAKVLGDPGLMPYGTDELRLIALGERMTGLSRHEPEGYRESLNQCATLAQAFGEGSGDRHNARRIALLASVIPTALLQVSDSGSAFAIINSINVTGSCSPFFFIVETLQENRKLGFPLNPTNLRSAGVANAGLSYAGELLETVKGRSRPSNRPNSGSSSARKLNTGWCPR